VKIRRHKVYFWISISEMRPPLILSIEEMVSSFVEVVILEVYIPL
jgi:hypothetical protein